jgi:hypothetical protein
MKRTTPDVEQWRTLALAMLAAFVFAVALLVEVTFS